MQPAAVIIAVAKERPVTPSLEASDASGRIATRPLVTTHRVDCTRPFPRGLARGRPPGTLSGVAPGRAAGHSGDELECARVAFGPTGPDAARASGVYGPCPLPRLARHPRGTAPAGGPAAAPADPGAGPEHVVPCQQLQLLARPDHPPVRLILRCFCQIQTMSSKINRLTKPDYFTMV